MPISYASGILPSSEKSRKVSIDLLLASIAFEELGLAHMLKAEAEKIYFVLSLGKNKLPSLAELLNTNKSVEQVLRKVIAKEILLAFQLEDVIELTKQKDKKPIEPGSITLDFKELRLDPDVVWQLIATVLPADAKDKSVTWTSYPNSVATVSGNGLVMAIAPGEATIVASTVNGHTAICSVIVPTFEMLFEELREKLDSGYALGKITNKNTYDKLILILGNAQDQYEKGHVNNAIKQLEHMIDTLHDEVGKKIVEAQFADETILMAEKLIKRLS